MGWQVALDDSRSQLLQDLEAFATNRVFTKTRNQPASVAFDLSLLEPDNAAADRLLGALSGMPRARVYQLVDGQNPALRFHTRLSALSETGGTDQPAAIACTFKDPLDTLLGDGSSTGRYLQAAESYTEDQGLIAKALIDLANSDSETGIDTGSGTIQATAAQTVSYSQYQNVGQAVTDLAGSDPGFDVELVPIEDSGNGKIVRLNIWAEQGANRETSASALFQCGAGTLDNISSVTRTTQPPANRVIVQGANGRIGLASDAGSIAAYGLWPLVVGATQVSDQNLLNQMASARLRPEWVKVVSFDPDPVSAPTPFVDYDIGDTCRVYVNQDSLQVDATVRIDSIAVTASDDADVDAQQQVTVEEVT